MESEVVSQAYEAYRNQLYGYLVSITRDADAAQDLLHESYARLTSEVRAGRAPRHTRAWLYRVGRNLATSRGRRMQVADRSRGRLVDHGTSASAEEHCLLRESGSELRAMLAAMDRIDRTSLIMAAEGYSAAEISRVVGRSENAVRTRVCRARSTLRAQLSPANGLAHIA